MRELVRHRPQKLRRYGVRRTQVLLSDCRSKGFHTSFLACALTLLRPDQRSVRAGGTGDPALRYNNHHEVDKLRDKGRKIACQRRQTSPLSMRFDMPLEHVRRAQDGELGCECRLRSPAASHKDYLGSRFLDRRASSACMLVEEIMGSAGEEEIQLESLAFAFQEGSSSR